MKTYILLFSLLVASSLYGCSQAAPKCGDDKTKGVVIKIAMDKAKESIKDSTSMNEGRVISDVQWEKEWPKISPEVSFTLDNIVTKEFKKDIGTYVCAADLNYSFRKIKRKIPITYSSELSADKSHHFIVEVRW